MVDEQSGLADLLADLIEKYAADLEDLDIADLSDTKIEMEKKVELLEKKQKSCIVSSTVMIYNNRDNTIQTKAKNMKERQRENTYG